MKMLLKLSFLLFLVSVLFTENVLAADRGDARRLNILTSFPPELYQPLIDRYLEIHPSVQLQILNKKTTAAIEEIAMGNARKFDLFWSSSLDAFEVLKRSGMLKPIDYQPHSQFLVLEDTALHDPERYYYSFALSGVGFMWNRKYLEENRLPIPTSWQTLTDPIYYGHLAMSTPSRSGTTHLIVESILQSMGWRQGWEYLLKTSGNLATVTARSFSVPEGVVSGRFGIGFVIDFLALGQMSINEDIAFRYGEPTLLMPAGIGLPERGENHDEAIAFIDFLLSPVGQKILLDPSISRLPVITDIYADAGEISSPELLLRIEQGNTRSYDTDISRIRYHLVNRLFDQMITYKLLDRRKIWKKFNGLNLLRGGDPIYLDTVKKAVLYLISEVPVTEQQSIDPSFASLFGAPPDAMSTNERDRHQARIWEDFVDENLRQAQLLLDDAMQKFSSEQE